jgi:hypothetical protein
MKVANAAVQFRDMTREREGSQGISMFPFHGDDRVRFSLVEWKSFHAQKETKNNDKGCEKEKERVTAVP